MTNTKINQFDRTNLRALRADFDAALASVAEKYGIRIATGNASFRPNCATFKVECNVIGEDGTVHSREREIFALYAPAYGLEADDLGKEFNYAGKSYTITGWLEKCRKSPIACRRADGKDFKFTVAAVKIALGRPLSTLDAARI